MTTTPVQLYVLDSAFTNRLIPTPPFFRSPGGLAQLSERGLSYFQTPYQIRDPRTTRSVSWAAVTKPSLLVDHAVYADFLAAIAATSANVSVGLFNIIDRLAFLWDPSVTTATIESSLLADSTISPYYQAGSFSISSATATGNVYAANGTALPYTGPTKVNFVFTVPSGSGSLTYAITAWLDNTTFLTSYANSSIIAVVPPTNYSDLLNQAFTTTTPTMATLAYGANFKQPLINTAAQSANLSGYANYTARVVSGSTSLNMSFGIAYVGQVPTFADMRTAIREAVESSGFGNPLLWKARIPELYVESRIYLVPIWDQLITSGSGTLYAGIASPVVQLNKAATALGSTNASTLVSTNGELLTAAYDLLPIVAVPDNTTQPFDNLGTLYPTYQAYAPTDPSFVYMSSDAQAFASMLNMALPVAKGVTTNPTYPVVTDGPLSYVSFTQSMVEFCILTRVFYDLQLGVSA